MNYGNFYFLALESLDQLNKANQINGEKTPREIFWEKRKFKIGKNHFLLPAYNEQQALPRLLKRIADEQSSIVKTFVVWVVDDGSKDDTASIAKKGIPGLDVRLVSNEKNMGLGQALITGIIAILREAKREHEQAVKLPSELVIEIAKTASLGNQAWEKAREKSDFSIFQPFLEKMVKLR